MMFILGHTSISPHSTQKRNSYNHRDIKHSSSNALLDNKKYSDTLNVNIESSSGRKDSQKEPS